MEEIFIEDTIVKTEYTIQEPPELEYTLSENAQEIVNKENTEKEKEEKKHKCETCGKLFQRRSYLWRHKIVHTGTKKHECNLCSKKFSRAETLKYHMLVHSTADPVKCKICQKSFKNKETLTRHKKTHSAERIHECGICGFKFYKKFHVRRHILEVHGRKPENPGKRPKKALPCRYCGKIFWQNREYATHMLQHHNDDNPFECSVCLKKFKLKRNLARHLSCHETDKPFSCPICGQSFKRREYVRNHQITHKNVQKANGENSDARASPFQCSLCLKKFKQKIYLKRHMICHKTGKPFCCSICGMSLKRKSYLQKHMARHKTKSKKIANPANAANVQKINIKIKEEKNEDDYMNIPSKTQIINQQNSSVEPVDFIKIEKE